MKKILIVRAPFREVFMPEIRTLFGNQYEIDELLDKPQKLQKSVVQKLFHKFINLYYIHVLKKRSYYIELNEKRKLAHFNTCLQKIEGKKYDHILCFRGDHVPTKALQKLRMQTTNLINYQFDGAKMCPKIWDKKIFFDKIYSFEKDDIKNYPELNLQFATNFYFAPITSNQSTPDFDFFYVGVGLDYRIEILNKLVHILPEHTHKYIVSSTQIVNAPLKRGNINYIENLNYVSQAKCLIDIKLPVHNGLSFRIFESLIFEKKIITDNASVKEYDFYHPHNILVVDYNCISKEEIQDFLNKDYYKIDEKVRNYYSLKEWLIRILK